jgi:hypothetical protein
MKWNPELYPIVHSDGTSEHPSRLTRPVGGAHAVVMALTVNDVLDGAVTAARMCGAGRLPTGQVTVLASANHFWYHDYRIPSRADTAFV